LRQKCDGILDLAPALPCPGEHIAGLADRYRRAAVAIEGGREIPPRIEVDAAGAGGGANRAQFRRRDARQHGGVFETRSGRG